MSRGHSSRIEHGRCILGHPFHRVRTAGGVASAHAAIIEIDRPVAGAQDGQDAKPHFMCKAKTHDEQHGRTAALFIPIKVVSLVGGNVGHFFQSNRFEIGMPTPIYMVSRVSIPKMKWPWCFTPEPERGSMEAPPRISRRNGISVC